MCVVREGESVVIRDPVVVRSCAFEPQCPDRRAVREPPLHHAITQRADLVLFDETEAEFPAHEDSFAKDGGVHFGLSVFAIHKQDRDFFDAKAFLDGAPRHLDLERVAFGAYVIEFDGFEDFASKALESTGEIADRDPEDGAGVEASATAEDLSANGPVACSAAFDVAGTENEIGVLEGGKETGEIVGIVREVAIHLLKDLVIAVESVAKAIKVSGSEAEFSGASENKDAVIVSGALFSDIARPIGGVVIDNEDMGVFGCAVDGVEQAGEVFAFVVGGDDDQSFWRCIRRWSGHRVSFFCCEGSCVQC